MKLHRECRRDIDLDEALLRRQRQACGLSDAELVSAITLCLLGAVAVLWLASGAGCGLVGAAVVSPLHGAVIAECEHQAAQDKAMADVEAELRREATARLVTLVLALLALVGVAAAAFGRGGC